MASSLFKSVLANWIGIAIAVAIGLFISPFVLHAVGSEDYGLWVIASAITGQLIILDFGIGYALTREAAALRQKRNSESLSKIASSAAQFLSLMAILSLLIATLICPWLNEIFAVPSGKLYLLRTLLLISALDVALSIRTAHYHGLLAGSERYDLINVLNVARIALNAILVILILPRGGVLTVSIVALSSRILFYLGLKTLALRENSSLTLTSKNATLKSAMAVVKYGTWVTVIVAAVRIISHIDNLVIGAFVGVQAVTLYAIALLIIDQIRMFAEKGSSVLFPRFSASSADGEITKTLILRWALYGELLCIAIGVPILITGEDFITLWMGAEFRESALFLAILTVPFFFTMPAQAFANYFYATKQQAWYAKICWSEALMNLALSLILVNIMGARGVALGTFFPAALIGGIFLPWRAARRCGVGFDVYFKYAFLKTAPVLIAYGAIFTLLHRQIGSGNWYQFIAINILGLCIFTVLALLFAISREDRAYFGRRLKGVRGY